MSAWKIAGHTLGTPNQTVPEAIELFAAAGLDAAEVIWQDGYLSGIPETNNTGLVDLVAEASKIHDIPVVGLTPYMSGLNSPDEAVRTRDIERFRSCIRDARKLGATVVRVYAGEYTPDLAHRHAELWDQLVTGLRTLGPFAGDHGVVLAVENHFNTMTMTAAETVDLVRDVDHPSVGILYDQANLTFTHSEPFQQAIAAQSEFIRHVHVKDLIFVDRDRPFSATAVATVSGDERAVRSRVVGEGELEWPAILSSLAATGYPGALSLEYEYRWHPQDLPEPSDGFRRGGDTLRSLAASFEQPVKR